MHGPSEWSGPAAQLVAAVTDRWVLAGALAAGEYRRVQRGTTDVDFLVERIDLLLSTVHYQDLAIDRGREQHVLTVEDVIMHKLIAWRPRDREDIASILAAGHELDLDYIEHWAREWEVLDRWKDATDNRLSVPEE